MILNLRLIFWKLEELFRNSSSIFLLWDPLHIQLPEDNFQERFILKEHSQSI